MSFKTLAGILNNRWCRRSSESYIRFLRKKGVEIGESCIFRSPGSSRIDIMRPSLVTIGDCVDFNKNFQLMTHDFSSTVFLHKYGEFINSSGRVTIGNNVYFGTNVIVLKGVTIGNNCIIGAGSVVTRDIPSDSVAAGVPCRVICSLDDYYERRKKECVEEAFELASSIKKRFHREPTIDDFWPEFGLFIDSRTFGEIEDPYQIENRLKEFLPVWLAKHDSLFEGFNDFIIAAKNNERERNNCQ